MRSRTILCLSLSLSLAAVPAVAVDLPVVYTVDAVALKAAVAGTGHTYELFSDAACSELLDSAVSLIDDGIVVSLKRAKISGAAKAPKTAEIRQTLEGVSAPGHVYLKVTGTGITPVGGACQAQAAVGDLPATCNDGLQNQDESDVDCGGASCNACDLGETCTTGSDCASTACSGGLCVPNGTCSDGIQNQNESDTDCGGVCGNTCTFGEQCNSGSDCTIGICLIGGTCG